jgi:hypothetical protein
MKRLLIILLLLPLPALACESVRCIDIVDTREVQLYDISAKEKMWDSNDTTPEQYYPIPN